MIDRSALSPQTVATLKQEILSSLHCALPGIVERFDPDSGTAVIRPAVRCKGTDLQLLRDMCFTRKENSPGVPVT